MCNTMKEYRLKSRKHNFNFDTDLLCDFRNINLFFPAAVKEYCFKPTKLFLLNIQRWNLNIKTSYECFLYLKW